MLKAGQVGQRDWVLPLSAVALGLVAFVWSLDLSLVWAHAQAWLNPKSDMTAMVGGYEALLREPWRVPPTTVERLTSQPVSIVFTDSIPWLALLLKASGAGESINVLGLFLLLSYPLQALAMLAVLRAFGVRHPAVLLFGAALALLHPPWLLRQFGHIALSGHWILLFGLALAVTSLREGLTRRRIGAFALLCALATGVHAYFLPPLAACLAAAGLSEIAQRRPNAWRRALGAGLASLAAVGVSAVVLGYGLGGARQGAEALGVYGMNLLGPLLPVGSQVFGQVWTGRWFTGVTDPSGAQSFEGAQYLGAGALALIGLAAFASALALRRAPPRRRALVRWAPLIGLMIGLSLWAVGWNVYLGGHLIAEVPKPSGRAAELLAIFRAHGRFFWLPGYLLLALAIVWAEQQRRLWRWSVLTLALLVQAWDTEPVRQGLYDTFRPTDPSYPAALANSPEIRGRPWVFHPTYFCAHSPDDQRAIAELALLAIRTGGQTNTFPTARNTDPACDSTPSGIATDAAPGDGQIVVLTQGDAMEGGVLELVSQRRDCRRLRHGVICGADLPAGLDVIAAGELSAKSRQPILQVRLDEGRAPGALREGWADPDPQGKGIWSNAKRARLQLELPSSAAEGRLEIELVAIGFSDGSDRRQPMRVTIGGRPLAQFQVDTRTFAPYRFDLPAALAKPGPLELELELPEARSSAADPRLLGVALQSITVLQRQADLAGSEPANAQ